MSNDLTRDIDSLNKRAKQSTVGPKTNPGTPPKFYQCVVFYRQLQEKRNFLDRPFYVEKQYPSPEIFMDQKDMAIFAPYFVKRLIDSGLIGQEVVRPDKSVDDQLVIVQGATLTPTQMEKVDPMEGDHD